MARPSKGGADAKDIRPPMVITSEMILKASGKDTASEVTRVELVGVGPTGVLAKGCFLPFPNLTYLVLTNHKLVNLEPLKDASQVTYLNLAGNSFSEVTHILPLKHLTVLNIAGSNVKDLRSLKHHTSLNALVLTSTPLKRFTHIPPLPSLNSLVISRTRIARIKTTEQFPLLRKLAASYCSLTAFPGVFKNKRMHELRLAQNQIGSIPVWVRALPFLRLLDMAGNSVSQVAAIEPLKELKRLKHLTFKNTPLAAVDGYWKEVAAALPGLTELDGVKVEGGDASRPHGTKLGKRKREAPMNRKAKRALAQKLKAEAAEAAAEAVGKEPTSKRIPEDSEQALSFEELKAQARRNVASDKKMLGGATGQKKTGVRQVQYAKGEAKPSKAENSDSDSDSEDEGDDLNAFMHGTGASGIGGW